jgi:hypothetical protein
LMRVPTSCLILGSLTHIVQSWQVMFCKELMCKLVPCVASLGGTVPLKQQNSNNNKTQVPFFLVYL